MPVTLEQFLALTPEEVVAWCREKYPELGPVFYSGRYAAKLEITDPTICLPVFAFRLRDKAIRLPSYHMGEKYEAGLEEVYKCLLVKEELPPVIDDEPEYRSWKDYEIDEKGIIAASHLAINGGEWK